MKKLLMSILLLCSICKISFASFLNWLPYNHFEINGKIYILAYLNAYFLEDLNIDTHSVNCLLKLDDKNRLCVVDIFKNCNASTYKYKLIPGDKSYSISIEATPANSTDTIISYGFNVKDSVIVNIDKNWDMGLECYCNPKYDIAYGYENGEKMVYQRAILTNNISIIDSLIPNKKDRILSHFTGVIVCMSDTFNKSTIGNYNLGFFGRCPMNYTLYEFKHGNLVRTKVVSDNAKNLEYPRRFFYDFCEKQFNALEKTKYYHKIVEKVKKQGIDNYRDFIRLNVLMYSKKILVE